MTAPGIHRTIVRRDASAHCHGCQLAWSGITALSVATRHARATGHTVEVLWRSRYLYTPTGGRS